MKHTYVLVNISGPGLVVNGPAIAILEGLHYLGFQVSCEDWRGLDQWRQQMTEEQILTLIKEKAPSIQVVVEVEPLPWGG